MNMGDSLIAIDWGTSSLRAYRLGSDGEIEDTIAAPLGILKVPDRDFDRVFEETVGPWLSRVGDVPILTSGMIGSRQGWLEAPYLSCPVGVQDLAGQLIPLHTRQGRTIWFVPGVTRIDEDGVPDVMRGEETQIIASLKDSLAGQGIFVLPGTHSKWAVAQDGRIVWFATFMTGEVFAVLREHSILGRLMEEEGEDRAAFERGLAYGYEHNVRRGGLLKRLFSTRTLGLFDVVPQTGLRSYLSGLLIGAEIREATTCVNEVVHGKRGTVTVIGGSALSASYAQALRLTGLDCIVQGEEVVAQGLVCIATAAGLIRKPN